MRIMYIFTGLLGLAFVIAPFLFNYSENTAALWTSLVGGGIIMLLSYFEGLAEDKGRWEYIAAAVVGVITVVAPFVFGFDKNTTPMLASVVVGTILFLIAGSKLYFGNKTYQ